MSKQTVSAMVLLLALMAVSATAYAGATISDKRYWPSEARQGAHVSQGGWSSAFASSAGPRRAYSSRQPQRLAGGSGDTKGARSLR